MFSKEMAYQDLTIKAGIGGIDLQLGNYKKHYSGDEFMVFAGPLLYPAIAAEAKKEETQS
jgi:hypothetical protein